MRRILVLFSALLILSSLSAGTMTAEWEWLLDDPDVTVYRYQLDGEDPDGWTEVSGDTDSVTIENLDAERNTRFIFSAPMMALTGLVRQNVRLKPLCDSILLAQMELAEVESCVYNCIQGGRDA